MTDEEARKALLETIADQRATPLSDGIPLSRLLRQLREELLEGPDDGPLADRLRGFGYGLLYDVLRWDKQAAISPSGLDALEKAVIRITTQPFTRHDFWDLRTELDLVGLAVMPRAKDE